MDEIAADEQHAQAVVVAVAEAECDAAVKFEEAVDRLYPAMARPVEVGQE